MPTHNEIDLGSDLPEQIRPAPPAYLNCPMTRDRAFDIAINFGLSHGWSAKPEPHGAGYSMTVPMEVLALAIPAVAEPRRKRKPPNENTLRSKRTSAES